MIRRPSRRPWPAILLVALFVLGSGSAAALPLVSLPEGPTATDLVKPRTPGEAPSAIAPHGPPASLPAAGAPSPLSAPGFQVPTELVWAPGEDPLADVATRLISGRVKTLEDLSLAVGDYYRGVGYDLPPALLGPDQKAPGTKFDDFSENDTLNFPYPLGDINGDGYDDILLNVYCVEFFCRFQGGGFNTVPPSLGSDVWCGTPHRIFALSGYNGTVLWESTLGQERTSLLSIRTPSDPACPIEFVVGMVPDNITGRNAILMYRVSFSAISFEFLDRTPWGYILHHELRLLSAEQGEVLWSKPYQGILLGECDKNIFFSCSTALSRFVYAKDLLINPLLQVAPTQGARIIDRDTEVSLVVQGVGFNFTLVRGQALPGQTSDNPITENYQPQEWMARYHPITGKEMWRLNTFQPDLTGVRTLVPRLIQGAPLSPTFACWSGYWTYSGYAPWGFATRDACPGYTTQLNDPALYSAGFGDVGVALNQYWRHRPCCFDLTGDNVPDLSYTTMEWDAYPPLDAEAPKFLDSRLIVFDGATGKQLYAVQLAKDVQRFVDENYLVFGAHAFHVQQEVIGDANGDGTDDLLLHRTYWKDNFTQVVSVHDGASGRELWRHTAPERVASLVIGDASGDGGNDVLLIQWSGWEYLRFTNYDIANVTRTLITVHQGSDGAVLWSAETFNAPIDLYMQYHLFRQWGVPDVTGDGVGDVLVDDPVFLPDLTVVHRLSYLSGTDGSKLYSFDSVGTFATVSLTGDVTGDGADEFTLLSGDAPDLWFTQFNGSGGQPMWSRRMMAPRIAEYTLAIPSLSHMPLATPNGTAILSNFHMFFRTTLILGGAFFFPVSSYYPQMAILTGDGDVLFSYPRFWEVDLYIRVSGPTPASAAFGLATAEAVRPKGAHALAVTYTGMSVATVSVALLGLASGFGVAMWRFRP